MLYDLLTFKKIPNGVRWIEIVLGVGMWICIFGFLISL